VVSLDDIHYVHGYFPPVKGLKCLKQDSTKHLWRCGEENYISAEDGDACLPTSQHSVVPILMIGSFS